jgi:hypothetical protein
MHTLRQVLAVAAIALLPITALLHAHTALAQPSVPADDPSSWTSTKETDG